MSDLKKEVEMFNLIVGEHPVGGYSEDKGDILGQLERQASLVAEEGKEIGVLWQTYIPDTFIQELLKECVDVWYTNTYMESLLEACGVDVEGAKKAVIKNNNTKYTLNKVEADNTQIHHSMRGTPCYVDSVMVDGDVYYSVKRVPDRKVLKPFDYEPVNLDDFVPEEWR